MGGSNFTIGAPEPSSSAEPEPTMSEEEIVKIQFYKTYDVMTGVSREEPYNMSYYVGTTISLIYTVLLR